MPTFQSLHPLFRFHLFSSINIDLVFRPSRSGAIDGALAFTSDDPDSPFVQLIVSGSGRLGQLQDATTEAGLTGIAAGAHGISFNDYNNDGTLDLFVTSPSGHQLFRNNGQSYVDFTAFSGITGTGDSGAIIF